MVWYHDIIVNDSHLFWILLLCVLVLSRENEEFLLTKKKLYIKNLIWHPLIFLSKFATEYWAISNWNILNIVLLIFC